MQDKKSRQSAAGAREDAAAKPRPSEHRAIDTGRNPAAPNVRATAEQQITTLEFLAAAHPDLKDTVPLLRDNGFDNHIALMYITAEDMEQMGVLKGHQRILVHFAKELQAERK